MAADLRSGTSERVLSQSKVAGLALQLERRRLGELLTRMQSTLTAPCPASTRLGSSVTMRYIWRSKEVAMVITVELDPDTDQRLEELAARTGKSKAEHAAEILKYGIEDVEDYYSALEVTKRIERGEEKVYSLEEVIRDLGLER
ncbi:MAG: type II toxin-antitoxin system RelB family antitoxin [Devosia sp.]